MQALLALPVAKRADALRRLGDADFQKMVASVPAGQRDVFTQLLLPGISEERARALASGAYDAHMLRAAQEGAAPGALQVLQKRGVRVSADPGESWSQDEIDQTESALARVPASHLAGLELKQGNAKHSKFGDPLRDGGHTNVRTSAITMNGPNQHALPEDVQPHMGTESELAEHSPDKKVGHGGVTGRLEFETTHEIGHVFGNRHADIEARFAKASGWTHHDTAPNPEVARMRAGQELDFDGRTYVKSKYDEGWDSYETANIPGREGGETTPKWGYARGNSREQFAETYAKAVHTPEELYASLIHEPEEQLQEARARGARFAEIERLKQTAASRRAQWNIMRSEVFGVTDQQVAAEAKHLGGIPAHSGVNREKLIQEFQKQAEQCATPHQLQALRSRYAAKIKDGTGDHNDLLNEIDGLSRHASAPASPSAGVFGHYAV